MSEFVSLYDVIFGRTDTEENGDVALEIEAVPLVAVASAIEISVTDAYCYDRFGRMPIAKDDIKAEVLATLSDYHRVLMMNHPYDIGQYEMSIEEMVGETMWHRFGWLPGALPDFIELHKTWAEAHGDYTEITIADAKPTEINPAIDAPEEPKRNTNSVWHLANITLRLAIGDYLRGKGSVDDFVHELMSPKYTHKTSELLVYLECKGLKMDDTGFRKNLKLIFRNK